jgi:hypothetical protein
MMQLFETVFPVVTGGALDFMPNLVKKYLQPWFRVLI